MTSRDKYKLGCVFKILYPSDELGKKKKASCFHWISPQPYGQWKEWLGGSESGQQMMGSQWLWFGCLHFPLSQVSTRIWETEVGVSICYRASWESDFEADAAF